jgi:hypothetical protein
MKPARTPVEAESTSNELPSNSKEKSKSEGPQIMGKRRSMDAEQYLRMPGGRLIRR